ncbi:MAG: DUF5702 domain-containing protein [Lachnospiraceae bacterium]|nr:DUF5702 domain-containing protein [Lachnospiraceae bacterium]
MRLFKVINKVFGTYRHESGEISVFLALLLSVILSAILILEEDVRLEALRLKIELAMDEALCSCFSEYSQQLYKRFDLLFIDTGYKESEGDIDRLSEHLSAYISENISDKGSRSFLGLSLVDTKIRECRLASDGDGEIIMEQAVRFMKEYGELKYLPGIRDDREDFNADDMGRRFFSEWDDRLSELYGYDLWDNPSMRIRDQAEDSSFLLLQGTSGALYSFEYTDVPSKRELSRGVYAYHMPKSAESQEIFIEYLLQKLGCYTEAVGDQALTCELEYLISGNFSDKENLKAVFDRLMSHREEINLMLIMNSPDMLCEVEGMVLSCLQEEDERAKSLLGEAIIYAWAYAESLIEVNRLFCGGKCDMNASRSRFILPLEELDSFTEYLGEGGGTGLSYKEYLGLMLYKCDLGDLKNRFMDIVEIYMQRIENDSFRIDSLVEYVEAQSSFSSVSGYEKTIKRSYGY